MIPQCPYKERPLFHKTVLTIRKIQRGEPTGHMVAFDAVCSGMQIMSVMTGCLSGARATGLVDPDRRADAYTEVTAVMDKLLGYLQTNGRSDVKKATMTTLYGSKMEPKMLYGDDTPELKAFYDALKQIAPEAVKLLDYLLLSWNPTALSHEWRLPDNHRAFIPVMETITKEGIEVDELNHSTFTYQYKSNETKETARGNAANTVHSVDAYVLRCLERRCNYDVPTIVGAKQIIDTALAIRYMGTQVELKGLSEQDLYMVEIAQERFEKTQMADITTVAHIDEYTVHLLETSHLEGLKRIVDSVLEHEPFPIVTVHDAFACHANNMNHLRKHYNNVLAELADSTVLDDLLSQLYGQPATYKKGIDNLSDYIRQSNYGIN